MITMLYHVKDKIKTPATLTVTQFKQLIPIPLNENLDNYYIEEDNSLLSDSVYVLPRIDISHYVVRFHAMQSVNSKSYEPSIHVDNKMLKGYQAIIEFFKLGKVNTMNKKYVDALLIPYTTFSSDLVTYLGNELYKNEYYPVFTRKDARGNGQYFGFNGLKRLFPYTNVSVLHHFYNDSKKDWNQTQLETKDIITKYKIRKEGNNYILEIFNKEHKVTSQKDVVNLLRDSGEIITNKNLKEIFQSIKVITIEDSIYKKFKISHVGHNTFEVLEKGTGEITIINSKAKLQKLLGVNWKQIDLILADNRIKTII